MAELDVGKLDESNDSIKLNGVPSDTTIGFKNENESRIDNAEQGSCVSRKRAASNDLNNVDKLHDSSTSIGDKSTSALANGHFRIEPVTGSECGSTVDNRRDAEAEPAERVSSAQVSCLVIGGGGAKESARPTDECVISNGEESNSNSSVVDDSRFDDSGCSLNQTQTRIATTMPLDVRSCSSLGPNEIARTNSGLSITMVSTPKSSEEQNSRWDRTTNDERKTDCVGEDAASEVSNKDACSSSSSSAPDKQNKKYNKKSIPSVNITPRRSSRNINKQRTYSDKDGEVYEDGSQDGVHQMRKLTEDDDIEEVTPTDPLADDSSRSKLRNKTIVVSDTKGLVEFATNARISSKCNKKEPTLVIIDTKSILSGRGPVPVSQSSGSGGGGGGGGTSILHSTSCAAPFPVSLPNSAGSLNSTSRGLSVTSSGFSVIPIGLPAQSIYPHFRNPPQMKPIVVGPASTTVTPISIPSAPSPSPVSVTAVSVPAPTKQPPVVLPSLTDDMFVVEAPSFIVPYVYEKPPMKALKEYIEKIETEIKEAEEKEAEEKQRLEAEEKSRLEALEKERLEALEKEKSEALEKELEEAEKNENKDKESDKKEEEEDGLIAEKNESAVADEAAEADKDDKCEKSEDESAKKEVDDVAMKSVTEKPEAMEVCSEELERVSSAAVSSNEVASDKTKPADSSTVETEKKDAPEVPTAAKDDSKKSTSTVDESKKQPLSFFDNPLGKFFIQIGLNLVQEHVQTDLLRSQKRKRDKEGENCSPEVHATISELTRTLESSKENNDPFKLETKKCELCSFRTESLLVMAHHLETPHMKNYTYRCNFCPLEVRSPHDILFHMEAEHNVRGRLERAPAFHQCPNCPFEDNQKGKLTRHMVSCLKKYRSEKNQEPPLDWEPPAKIPRVTRNRPPSMSPGNAVYQAAMSGLKQVPQNTLLPKLMPNATNVKQNMMNTNKRPSTVNTGFVGRFPNANTQPNFQQRPISMQNSNQGLMYRTPPLTNSQTQVLLPQNYQFSATSPATLYQSSNVKQPQQGLAAAKLMNQPSISITPLPRQNPASQQGSSSSNAVMNSTSQVGKGGKSAPSASSSVAGSNNKSFVVCEICDGYIKDLEQLRNHMQWIHKVKIHPKMIYNRPPLNCQKCQFRFFTDQGLERHLLGSHGLVTSSMQEAANKGKDGGRCPVCGRVYQWKLLNHVARDHQMGLKPAHLSYKCTVCTATFGMYKQFESHVYSAHSVVAKRAMDPKKPPQLSATAQQNDALLKPLKINDEITIIPQPVRSTKPMNKMISNASSIVNSRSKDGFDDKFCHRKCIPEFFSTVEEFNRHLLTGHVRPFTVKLTRVDSKSSSSIPRANETENLPAVTASVLCQQPVASALPEKEEKKKEKEKEKEKALREEHKLKSFQIRLPNLRALRVDRVYRVQIFGKKKNEEEGYAIPASFLQFSMRVDESRSIEIRYEPFVTAPQQRLSNIEDIPIRIERVSTKRATSATVTATKTGVAPALQLPVAFLSQDTIAELSSFGNHFLTSNRKAASSNSAMANNSNTSKSLPAAYGRPCPTEDKSSSLSRTISFSTAYTTDTAKTHPLIASSLSRSAVVRGTTVAADSRPSVPPSVARKTTKTLPTTTTATPSLTFQSYDSKTFIPVVLADASGSTSLRLLRGRLPSGVSTSRVLVPMPRTTSSKPVLTLPERSTSPKNDVIVLSSSDSDDAAEEKSASEKKGRITAVVQPKERKSTTTGDEFILPM